MRISAWPCARPLSSCGKCCRFASMAGFCYRIICMPSGGLPEETPISSPAGNWSSAMSPVPAGLPIDVSDHLTERRAVKQCGAFWQHRFWEHLIRDEQDFSHHLDYLHGNPLKHGLGRANRRLAVVPLSLLGTTVRLSCRLGRCRERWGGCVRGGRMKPALLWSRNRPDGGLPRPAARASDAWTDQ